MYLPPQTVARIEFVKNCTKTLHEVTGSAMHNYKGAVFADSGISTPLCNAVVMCGIEGKEAPDVVQYVTHYFQEKKLPYSWWLEESEEHPLLLEALTQAGFSSIGLFLGMTISLADLESRAESPLEIREVREEADFQAWGAVIAEAFEMAAPVSTSYGELFSKSPGLHLAGYQAGRAVTTGTLLGAYLYNVATLKEERSKGYATALVWELLQRAKAQGVEEVGLIGSPLAAGIYKRLGFETVARFHIFV